MGSCNECGGATSLNFPLCRSCWSQRTESTSTARGPARPPALKVLSSPLDIACDYVFPTYVPDEAVSCGAGIAQACRFSVYVPYIDLRVLQIAGLRLEVHESRYRTWARRGKVTVDAKGGG